MSQRDTRCNSCAAQQPTALPGQTPRPLPVQHQQLPAAPQRRLAADSLYLRRQRPLPRRAAAAIKAVLRHTVHLPLSLPRREKSYAADFLLGISRRLCYTVCYT